MVNLSIRHTYQQCCRAVYLVFVILLYLMYNNPFEHISMTASDEFC